MKFWSKTLALVLNFSYFYKVNFLSIFWCQMKHLLLGLFDPMLPVIFDPILTTPNNPTKSLYIGSLRFVTGDSILRNVTSPFGNFYLAGQSLLGPKNHASIGEGLHFLVEIELRMAKMPTFTNPKRINDHLHVSCCM